MKNRLFLRNSLYIIIVLLPYVWAWGYAKGISYYENVLTWNTDVPYAFKLIWYYMVIAFTIVVLLFHSELLYHMSMKLRHGKKIILLINGLYAILYPISMQGLYSSKILNFTSMLYSYSAYTHMFALSCVYLIYNVYRRN